MQKNHFKLIFLALVFFTSGVSSDSNLIKQVCRETSNTPLCISTLQSDRRSSSADTPGLIRIMIDAVDTEFTDALAFVKHLMRRPQPPAMRNALKDCATLFQFVLDNDISTARSAVPGNPKFGEDAMNDAADNGNECVRAASSSGTNSRLVNRSKLLYQISHVTATMIRIIE